MRWSNSEPGRRPVSDYDAVLFIQIFGFPLIPIRAAHIFRHQDTWSFSPQCEWHPIRWSFSLVLCAWLRRTCWVMLVYAIPLLVLAILVIVVNNDPQGVLLLKLCITVLVGCPIILGLLRWLDRRNREIRTVIGNWRLGSGDPATFDRAWMTDCEFSLPQPLYGVDTFAQGAVNSIRMHNWWGAMFAARLCLLLEDEQVGKELTDTILNDPEVRDAIAQVRASPERWHALLGPGRYESK